YYQMSWGRYVAFDAVRYYPNPDGGRGYVNYLGIINGSSEYDGKWFRANAAGEAALRAVIAGSETREMPASTASIVRIFLNAFAAFASQ
ncbi:MAG: hypothetical protein LC121_27220, partial [Anaerolineae bacterium]|nr:hypothetical protein [Anaerolineae bacterium]